MIPQNKEKFESPALFSAEDFLHSMGKGAFTAPPLVFICYQSSLRKYVNTHYKPASHKGAPFHLKLFGDTHEKVGISSGFGYGSPAAVLALEELVACGVKKILNFGIAGSLSTELGVGEVVLCDKAVRDEGTSHHYLPPEKFAYPSRLLTRRITHVLTDEGIPFLRGGCWTTDAPYRETLAEIAGYGAEGILSVDMETAALFAVAEYRKVEIASLFVISDLVHEGAWQPNFQNSLVSDGLEKIFSLLLNNADKILEDPEKELD